METEAHIVEVWHAFPEGGTGRTRVVPGPASTLLYELDEMIQAERHRLRALRAGHQSSLAAACRGRLEALRVARQAVVSAQHDVARLSRVQQELLHRADQTEVRARIALFRRRTELKSHAAMLQRASIACLRTVERLEQRRPVPRKPAHVPGGGAHSHRARAHHRPDKRPPAA